MDLTDKRVFRNFAENSVNYMTENASPTGIGTCRGLMALSPIFVFAALYLGTSVAARDFYAMPLSLAFVAASAWAVVIGRGHGSFAARIEQFSRAAGSTNILSMIWIFILAGAFASLASGIGAIEATVNLALRYLPLGFMVPGLFLAACFISLSIGTSVGTVVALTPLAVEIASESGNEVGMLVAALLGGAFFGDNLSFISDTTIAATRSQNVPMNAKFRANLAIVLPAAIATLAIYVFVGAHTSDYTPSTECNYWLVIPYIAVLVMAVAGVNVNIVLVTGILASITIGLSYSIAPGDMARAMGNGIDGMGGLIVVTLLAAGMLGLIKAYGGIDWMLGAMTRHVSGSRGAKATMLLLVGAVNACTANNTVAIITVGSISRGIAERFGIARVRAASILDTGSCIVQCLIPYGAQTLLATGMAGISPAEPWPWLYYPWALLICVVAAIVLRRN